ncbi:MAG: polysaccharide biosynthesis C-terminal domain-containing protein [Clostridiales bacterium]|nr:polysaccharide biosynthesis C-terminal domain-containing protein [Clostridiales bacterium]
MSGNRRVLSNSALYSLNSFLLKGINLVLLRVYTTYLSTSDYGVADIVNSFSDVAMYVVAFSLYAAVRRYYVEYRYDRERLKRFYGTIICFVLATSIAFLITAILMRGVFVSTFFNGLDFFPTVLIALISFVFHCQCTIYESLLQGMQNGKKFTVTSMIYFAGSVFFNMLFVVFLKLGANGMLLAGMTVNICFFVFILIDLKKNDLITFCIDGEFLKTALKYSAPMIPHDVSGQIAIFISKVILKKNSAISAVGVYGVASKFGFFTNSIQAVINLAYAPWFFEKMKEGTEQAKREINKMVKTLLWVYGVFILGVGLFSQEAMYIFTSSEYRIGWIAIPLLAVSYSIKTIYYFYWDILTYHEKATKFIFMATVTGNLVNILASATLIPKYGLYGPGLAQIISNTIIAAITVFICRFFEGAGYSLKRMIGMIALNVVFMGAGLFFSYTKFTEAFSLGNFFYKMALFAVYLGIAAFSMKKDILVFIQMIKKKFT